MHQILTVDKVQSQAQLLHAAFHHFFWQTHLRRRNKCWETENDRGEPLLMLIIQCSVHDNCATAVCCESTQQTKNEAKVTWLWIALQPLFNESLDELWSQALPAHQLELYSTEARACAKKKKQDKDEAPIPGGLVKIAVPEHCHWLEQLWLCKDDGWQKGWWRLYLWGDDVKQVPCRSVFLAKHVTVICLKQHIQDFDDERAATQRAC